MPRVPKLLRTRREVEDELRALHDSGVSILTQLDRRTSLWPPGFLVSISDASGWAESVHTKLSERFDSDVFGKEFLSVAADFRIDEGLRTISWGYKAEIEGKVLAHRLDYVEWLIGILDQLEEPPDRVFVVHGRTVAWLDAVTGLLADVVPGNPVSVLQEKANRSQALIEKLENEAKRACYAVLIHTGDDEGRLRDKFEDGDGVLRPRARQNVVLETGLFMGLIGRRRTAILHEEGIEQPSDLQGVTYISLDDAGRWKQDLARELEDAGLEVEPQ